MCTIQTHAAHLTPAEQALPARLQAAGNAQPPGAQVHLPWALGQFLLDNGYVPATAQETLLQAYLGAQLASTAASLAQNWGRLTARPPAPIPQPHQPLPHTTPPARPRTAAPEVDAEDDATSDTSASTTTTSTTTNTTGTTNATATGTGHDPPTAPAPGPSNNPTDGNADSPSNTRQFRQALASLDRVDLETLLQQKCFFFQRPPPFLKGRIRQALTSALTSILEARSPESSVRAWTLWLLLPRMLLHRPPGTRILPKADWHHRMHQFQNGHWLELLAAARLAANTNPDTTTANTQPSPQQRADRARHLVHLGELSAARQALTAGPTAPCTQQTLDELRDPSRRPAALYEPPDDQITTFQPEQPAELPMATIIQNLRRSRKGAAPGPSGLTADTLRLLLVDEPATHQLATVAQHVARAKSQPP